MSDERYWDGDGQQPDAVPAVLHTVCSWCQFGSMQSSVSHGSGAGFAPMEPLSIRGKEMRIRIMLAGLISLLFAQPAMAANIVVAFGNGSTLGNFEYDSDSLPTLVESWWEGTETEIYNTGQLKSLNVIGSDGLLHPFASNAYSLIQAYRSGDFLYLNVVSYSKESGYFELGAQLNDNPKTSINLPTSYNDKDMTGHVFYETPDGVYDYSLTSFAVQPTSSVPETATWVSMFIGFGMMGGVARLSSRRRRYLQTAVS